MKRIIFPAIIAVSVCFNIGTSAAQDPTPEQIIKQLQPTSKSRSIKLNKGVTVVPSPDQPADTPPSVNLYVNFEYNSARLRQDTEIVLDSLAYALGDQRLSGLDFLIAGHTDAAGGDMYNLRLSEMRALSVKAYLVRRHGLDPGRFVEAGYGETRLLDPLHPHSEINRRVQIITIMRQAQ